MSSSARRAKRGYGSPCEAVGLATWSWDLRTDEVSWSPAMQDLHGRSGPVTGRSYIDELVHPHDREQVRREVSTLDELRSTPHRIVRPDGSERWVMAFGRLVRDEAGAPLKIVGGSFDITAQRTLEEQLRQAQKMEAVGQLAAGIAHNFNNMLAGMLPVFELARPHMPAQRRHLLDEAQHAGERAAEMVRQLMTFAGGDRDQSRKTQLLGPILQRALAMCQRLFDRRIDVQLGNYAPDAMASVNANQLEQALINVLLNARDAVLEANREQPRITLELASQIDPRSRSCGRACRDSRLPASASRTTAWA